MTFDVPARLAAFGVLLALAGGGAALAGAAIGPAAAPDTGAAARSGHDGGGMGGMADEHDATNGHGTPEASGLAVSQGGYTLQAERTSFRPSQPGRLAFRITDVRGRVVRDGYEIESQRELHLIVVRRDLTGYQHLHPRRDASGTWSTPLTLPQAGVYRAYADFQIAGERHVLATDVLVPGDFRPRALPAPAAQAASDGYVVAVRTSGLKAGAESALTFTVSRDGRPVRALQPYLGARGHLVALREGDLGYLHVHPDASRVAPNEIPFMVELPTAGRYRLFLQFRSGGRVHTAAYTLEVPR